MFKGCTSLTKAPDLPATNLAKYCYKEMFSGCTSLTQAPELPATKLAVDCYRSMFSGCTSLTQAPKLPATDLAYNCYYGMFENCTALAQSPELPATYLADYCYYAMFSGCTSLTESPVLPALILGHNSYSLMFKGCKKLNYVTILATDNSASDCMDSFLSETASKGVFVMNSKQRWSNKKYYAEYMPYGTSRWIYSYSYYVKPSHWTTIYYNTDNGKYYLDEKCTEECDDHGNQL